MSPLANKFKKEMEQLSVDEMVVLHEELIGQIHERSDAGHGAAFRATLERRVEELQSGAVKGIDAVEVLRSM